MKNKTITLFFKRKNQEKQVEGTDDEEQQESKRQKASTSEPVIGLDTCNQQIPQANINEVDVSSLERDPAKRLEMWKYPVKVREQVRLAYISLGVYQPNLEVYKLRGPKNNLRRFKYACCEELDNWKKVDDGNNCPFLKHIKSSTHKKAFVFATNLVNQEAHIQNFIEKQSEEKIRKNRLRSNGTIDVVRWLTYQACALQGNDESSNSKNQGNFLELLKLLASYNDDLANVILANAPKNSKYTSSDIQQENLNIMANKVRKYIREEVGDSWFCIMVDESRDESKKEQMAIVLRFVDAKGVIRERFLDIVHVENTVAVTLKASLWNRLFNQNFDTGKIRGQGYNGSSNMSEEWNGLQALVRQYNPYAYYVHCFAHKLRLALVCVSNEVDLVHELFDKLAYVINVVCASSKRHDELRKAMAIEIKELLEFGEIKLGKGKNQVGTLRRSGDTRWGSHYNSICSLINMFGVTRAVLKGIMDNTTHDTCPQRGNAQVAYTHLKYDIEQPDMRAPYKSTQYRPRKNDLHVTFEHFYRVDLFMETLDKQIHEMDCRFNEQSVELLSLCATLCSKKINIGDIVLLVEKYYPMDFIEHERNQLRCQLETFQVERINNAKLSKAETLSDLCQTLVETGKNSMYDLVERVCRLLLTLPVSTATTEKGFSAMKIFKTRLRYKMSDDNLANSMVIYIEKEIASKFDAESIIEEFKVLKGRKAEL
uniref:uncharacterized protein LOC122591914 n=1 Tax=Erigeron canadensis TaxID=72917 RepID=UPI001CB91274|nr:uncharacterized protein LOC122591914 [Erigeron canadensis]